MFQLEVQAMYNLHPLTHKMLKWFHWVSQPRLGRPQLSPFDDPKVRVVPLALLPATSMRMLLVPLKTLMSCRLHIVFTLVLGVLLVLILQHYSGNNSNNNPGSGSPGTPGGTPDVSYGSESGAIGRLPNGISFNEILIVHGALMTLAWALAPAASIFIVRYCKEWGHRWFVWHRGLFISVTGLGSLIAFLLVLWFREPPHFNSAHSVIKLM